MKTSLFHINMFIVTAIVLVFVNDAISKLVKMTTGTDNLEMSMGNPQNTTNKQTYEP